MKTPRPQKQVKALFLSFTAASVLIAAPMIVMGCSSSNTTPFTAISVPTPTPEPTPTPTPEPTPTPTPEPTSTPTPTPTPTPAALNEFRSPIPNNTTGNLVRFFVPTTVTPLPDQIRLEDVNNSIVFYNKSSVVGGFQSYVLGSTSFPDLSGVDQIRDIRSGNPLSVVPFPANFCAYLAPSASTDPVADAVAVTKGCP